MYPRCCRKKKLNRIIQRFLNCGLKSRICSRLVANCHICNWNPHPDRWDCKWTACAWLMQEYLRFWILHIRWWNIFRSIRRRSLQLSKPSVPESRYSVCCGWEKTLSLFPSECWIEWGKTLFAGWLFRVKNCRNLSSRVRSQVQKTLSFS